MTTQNGGARWLPAVAALTVALAGALVGYGATRGNVESRLAALEACVRPLERDVGEIRAALAEIRTDIRWLRQAQERAGRPRGAD